MKSVFVFLLLLCTFGSAVLVSAQEDEETKNEIPHMDEEQQAQDDNFTLISSHPDIAVTYIFPMNPDKKLVAGELVDLLLGVKNFAPDRSFNITFIEASLRHPADFRYYIQNFTEFAFEDMIVGPLEELTISYFFTPNELLEPRDFGLVAEVYYIDMSDNNEYYHTFFNGTVEIIEPEGSLDAQTFFTYSGAIAVLGLLGFIGFKLISSWMKRRARKQKSFVEYGTVSGTRHQKNVDASENEWLSGTSADISKSKKSQQTRRRK
jgi:hypothetical protein